MRLGLLSVCIAEEFGHIYSLDFVFSRGYAVQSGSVATSFGLPAAGLEAHRVRV